APARRQARVAVGALNNRPAGRARPGLHRPSPLGYPVLPPIIAAAMLKSVLSTLLVLVIAIGGGAASVAMMIETVPPVGAVVSGPWTAFPASGTPEADPYSRARFAREG